ncbi:MAG: nitrogenase iron protein, partial [Chloroflexota bacterium]
MRQIAVYGKGGIGKSTTSSNLSAALSQLGEKVMQVGCDPKSDSTTTLLGGRLLTTILDAIRVKGMSAQTVKSVLARGFNDILCAEAGGPRPGTGCAGKGVAVALELLTKYGILEEYGISFALYDVLGDVVCGGFAQPMRRGYAAEIYLVTSGELMALYAANNIAKAVREMEADGAEVAIGGIIDNQRNVKGEEDLMKEFSERLNVPIVAHIPRSELVQAAEIQRKTVVETFPGSAQSEAYTKLAKAILSNKDRYLPTPM